MHTAKEIWSKALYGIQISVAIINFFFQKIFLKRVQYELSYWQLDTADGML